MLVSFPLESSRGDQSFDQDTGLGELVSQILRSIKRSLHDEAQKALRVILDNRGSVNESASDVNPSK